MVGKNRLLQNHIMKYVLPSLLIVCSCSATSTLAESAAPRIDLVIVVAVDQWRYSYFDQFQQGLRDGIAARAKQTGVWIENCFHQHAFTYTGPGHAVLCTGAYPSQTGIIGNSWYEPEQRREVYCVYDEGARIIGTTSDEEPVSPKRLLVDTVGDRLRESSQGKSKVFGVSIKDRASILMAGTSANAAYWMSYDGKWITCDHYMTALPGYLRNLNEERASFRYAKQSWNLLYPASQYQHGEQEDSRHERPLYEMTPDFPHTLPLADDDNYVRHLVCSPFGNAATLEIARTVIHHEGLGMDEHPDLLAINLSSTDYVGHAFGPGSLEAEDMVYRTDRQLAEFARHLEEKLEGHEWVMLITADHGVAPIPERALDQELRAGRNPLGVPDETGNIELLRQYLEAIVRAKLDPGHPSQPIIRAAVREQIFLDTDHPWMNAENAQRAREVITQWLQRLPPIAHAVSRDDLVRGEHGDALTRQLAHTFHRQRSGDVLYVLKPYQVTTDAAATHGSPWDYDRHVPLMVLGSRPIQHTPIASTVAEVSPAVIASTVASLVHVAPPSANQVAPLKLRFARP